MEVCNVVQGVGGEGIKGWTAIVLFRRLDYLMECATWFGDKVGGRVGWTPIVLFKRLDYLMECTTWSREKVGGGVGWTPILLFKRLDYLMECETWSGDKVGEGRLDSNSTIQEAGLPDGVYNVVQGEGGTGVALTNHDGCDKLSFTG